LSHLTHAYRPDIDGLRALAVLAVVGFHAFPNVINGGFVGVDIFFVISGFLITGILQKTLQNKELAHGDLMFWPYIATFYQRRIARIFPALLVVLITSLIFGWLLLLPAEFKALGKHLMAGAGFAANVVYWQEAGYFDAAAETKTLLHLWSLAVEEQFYLIWPLLLWVAWKMRLKAVWVVVLLLIASFAWNVSKIHSQPVATFYLPFSRFWELLAGALLAVLAINQTDADASKSSKKLRIKTSAFVQNLIALAGFLLIASAIYLLTKDKRFPGWWSVLPVLGSYLVISAGQQAWFNRVVLSNRVMVSIGLVSYPLYLWHWPLLAFLRGVQMEPPTAGMVWATVATSFVLAYLTYWLIEKPLRFGYFWRNKTRFKTSLLAAVMLSLGAAGYAVYSQNGVPKRFPPPLQSLLNIDYDYGESKGEGNGNCMVGIGGNQSQLPPNCTEKNPAFKKSVAMWGDSFTWHLAAALNERGKINNIGFNVIASAGCVPVMNVDTDYCQKGNTFVLETLQKQPFETILLAGNWTNDFQSELDTTLKKLQTMQSSKQLAAKNIFLVGPPPGWPHGLYKTAINAAIKDAPTHRVPERIRVDAGTGLIADFALDAKMRATAQRNGIHYISLLDKLCNADGCLVKLNDAPDALVGYDQGHLSLLGAEFVVKQFPPQLFE
jgi:peptidoglycan/LPS O-acetylase OafA/YrhL